MHVCATMQRRNLSTVICRPVPLRGATCRHGNRRQFNRRLSNACVTLLWLAETSQSTAELLQRHAKGSSEGSMRCHAAAGLAWSMWHAAQAPMSGVE
jgi:hypothetical protein